MTKILCGDGIFYGPIVRESRQVEGDGDEYCAYCGSFVNIPPGAISPCPECGRPVVPCNACGSFDSCRGCKLSEWANIIREAL